MPTKDGALNIAAEMDREVSETHMLWTECGGRTG
jgi:hypothetical protein